MITSSSFPLLLCLTISILFLLPLPSSYSADPDPLQDLCVADLSASTPADYNFPCKPISEITSDDFFFDGLTKPGNKTKVFGVSVSAGNVLTFPGLNTLGISLNRVGFAPRGIVPPHSHPRASEVGVVMEGKILTGFVTTKNVFYSKVLTAGEVFVIPRGLIHFQLNVGVGEALEFTAFNSHLPGSAAVPLNLFSATPSISDHVLTKTFLVGEDIIDNIRSKFRF